MGFSRAGVAWQGGGNAPGPCPVNPFSSPQLPTEPDMGLAKPAAWGLRRIWPQSGGATS